MSYTINCKINELVYEEDYLTMKISDLKFGNGSSIIYFSDDKTNNYATLKLDRSTFFQLTGKCWDGSVDDIDRLKKSLEGKVCSLSFERNIEKN